MAFGSTRRAVLLAVWTGCAHGQIVEVREMPASCAREPCAAVGAADPMLGTVYLWVRAPKGSRLVDAHLTRPGVPVCTGQPSVEWALVGETVAGEGPVDVSGAHPVVLRFPRREPWNLDDGTGVDLLLRTDDGLLCVRAAPALEHERWQVMNARR